MKFLEDITEEDIRSVARILVDTRFYRCYFDKEFIFNDVVSNTKFSYIEDTENVSRINKCDILNFLKGLRSLTIGHPVFYFKNCIDQKTQGFWPFKYIHIIIIDENTFTVRAGDRFLPVNIKNCTLENLLLGMPNVI